MPTTNTDNGVSFDALVRELLGLDPAALAKLSPADAKVADARHGLQMFMRRTLEKALDLVGKPEATLRLHSDATAKVLGWPDRATADLHALFVWALIRDARRFHGRSFVPLLKADRKISELPQKIDDRFCNLSTSALVSEAQRRLDVIVDIMLDAPNTPNPVSICALIRRHLAIEPGILMTPLYKSPALAAAAVTRDPEGKVACGLAVMLFTALHTYDVMALRQTSRIRLLTETDAEDGRRPNARSANQTTLLAAALIGGGEFPIWFASPRERTEEERALLRAATRFAYEDGSDDATEGLNRLAESDRHFAAYVGFPYGDRLMHRFARECDPTFARATLLVAAQEARLMASEADALALVRRAAARRRGAG